VIDNCKEAECIYLLGLHRRYRKIIIVRVTDRRNYSYKVLFIDPEELKDDKRIHVEDIINRMNEELYYKLQESVKCCNLWRKYLNDLSMNDLRRVDCVFELNNNVVLVENELLSDVDLSRLVLVFLSKLMPKFLTTLYAIDLMFKFLSNNSRIYFVVVYYVTDLLKEKMFNIYKIIVDLCKNSQICSLEIEDIDIIQMILRVRLRLIFPQVVINVLFKFVRGSDVENVNVIVDDLYCFNDIG